MFCWAGWGGGIFSCYQLVYVRIWACFLLQGVKWYNRRSFPERAVLPPRSIRAFSFVSMRCTMYLVCQVKAAGIENVLMISAVMLISDGSTDWTISFLPSLHYLNPPTDGGQSHLSTDREGAYHRPPRRSRKRSKLETSSKWHWIRADESKIFTKVFLGHVKNDTFWQGSKSSK